MAENGLEREREVETLEGTSYSACRLLKLKLIYFLRSEWFKAGMEHRGTVQAAGQEGDMLLCSLPGQEI